MKKYDLYLTFSIIIILPTPGRDWDGAAACQTSHGRHVISSRPVYEIGLYRGRQSNIPKQLSADSDQ